MVKNAVWLFLLAGFGCAPTAERRDHIATTPEARAIAFLSREVPAWSRENGCYSCHNNGDAARALYAARLSGFSFPSSALEDTTAWVLKPQNWDKNKGDPAFSDKRLANIQFAFALLAAIDSGSAQNTNALARAAERVAADQAENGAWPIDAQNPAGSPATYGTMLATFTAWRILHKTGGPAAALRKAETWVRNATPRNVPEAAVLLSASAQSGLFVANQSKCLEIIRRSESREGGWGPYADSPPEAFDTALVLLALAELRRGVDVAEMITRGREFLVKEQNTDGSWPATTRPRGGESYAQTLSTTGWATLALLKTFGMSDHVPNSRSPASPNPGTM